MSLIIFGLLATGSAAVVAMMARIGVLDHPGPRSSHLRPTPKGGGVGIVAASLAGLALFPGPIAPRLALGMGGLVVAALGYWDDHHDFPAGLKFAVQLGAATLPVAFGLVPPLTPWPGLNGVATVGWILLVINAVNFIDGLNGLAAGSAAIAASGFRGGGLTIGLIAGVLGFLPFNYPRARIFMGDVGSQFCGYLLAVLALLGATGPHPLLVPCGLAGILFDVIFTLGRRLCAGDRITQAHRGHLYQMAHRAGVADWLVTLIYWGFAVWGVGLALLPWRIWSVPLLMAPPTLWLIYVARRALRNPVGRW